MNNNILIECLTSNGIFFQEKKDIESCHNTEDKLKLSQKPCRITLPILIFIEYNNKVDIQKLLVTFGSRAY